jgi:hypothetical protein
LRKTDGSFDLRLDHVRVDSDSAVNCGNDAVDLDRGTGDGDLGDHGDARVEGVVIGHSSPATCRQALRPSRTLGGEPQDRCVARLWRKKR